MELRWYQQAAVDAVWQHIRTREDNPCVVIPTGGGKTPVIASMCKTAALDWGGRVCVLAHVKELLEQTAEKIRLLAPQIPLGIYSAGLGRKDLGYAVTVAGVQSIFKKAGDLGPVNIILVDEAHMIPEEDAGMYRQFIADAKIVNPDVRVVGLTATPYRLKSGEICAPGNILNHVCFEVGVRELIAQGFLSPLKSRSGTVRANLGNVHVRGGEFVAAELEAAMDAKGLVDAACREIVDLTAERRSVLIFSSGVKHGEHIQSVLAGLGHECGFLTGETLDFERATIISRFKNGSLKYLCNVNVLTTGFDAPNVDCVALLRGTMSPGLYYQMVGRGFRLSPGKVDCLVLDYGTNVLRHGPVDAITSVPEQKKGNGEAPAKECDNCHALIHAGCLTCPECGHIFPPPENKNKHEATASTAGVISGEVKIEEKVVSEVAYCRHEKKLKPGEDPKPPTLRVDYTTGFNDWVSEWVCIEHPKGQFAHNKAVRWWKERCTVEMPTTVDEAVEIASMGLLGTPISLKVKTIAGKPFPEIVSVEMPDQLPDLTPAEMQAFTKWRMARAEAARGEGTIIERMKLQEDEIPF